MKADNELIKAGGFFKTFKHYPVHDEWMQELYNYIILGYHPGSFHTSMFANDLYYSACHSHVSNEWKYIVAFMKWLGENAPEECWGNRELVNDWLAMNKEEREVILFKKGYIITDEEVTFKILETV